MDDKLLLSILERLDAKLDINYGVSTRNNEAIEALKRSAAKFEQLSLENRARLERASDHESRISRLETHDISSRDKGLMVGGGAAGGLAINQLIEWLKDLWHA